MIGFLHSLLPLIKPYRRRMALGVLMGILAGLMEPLLMVVLGGIIAVIVIAMYLPIFSMANTISN